MQRRVDCYVDEQMRPNGMLMIMSDVCFSTDNENKHVHTWCLSTRGDKHAYQNICISVRYLYFIGNGSELRGEFLQKLHEKIVGGWILRLKNKRADVVSLEFHNKENAISITSFKAPNELWPHVNSSVVCTYLQNRGTSPILAFTNVAIWNLKTLNQIEFI